MPSGPWECEPKPLQAVSAKLRLRSLPPARRETHHDARGWRPRPDARSTTPATRAVRPCRHACTRGARAATGARMGCSIRQPLRTAFDSTRGAHLRQRVAQMFDFIGIQKARRARNLAAHNRRQHSPKDRRKAGSIERTPCPRASVLRAALSRCEACMCRRSLRSADGGLARACKTFCSEKLSSRPARFLLTGL
jgi:hypothetical protein